MDDLDLDGLDDVIAQAELSQQSAGDGGAAAPADEEDEEAALDAMLAAAEASQASEEPGGTPNIEGQLQCAEELSPPEPEVTKGDSDDASPEAEPPAPAPLVDLTDEPAAPDACKANHTLWSTA